MCSDVGVCWSVCVCVQCEVCVCLYMCGHVCDTHVCVTRVVYIATIRICVYKGGLHSNHTHLCVQGW